MPEMKPTKLLSFDQLRTEKGIPYSKGHLWRLVKAKKFPAPVKLAGFSNSPNAWADREIDDYISAALRDRDGG